MYRTGMGLAYVGLTPCVLGVSSALGNAVSVSPRRSHSAEVASARRRRVSSCAAAKDPPASTPERAANEDDTMIVGEKFGSLEDALMKGWDQIEHFGTHQTILEPPKETKEGSEGNDVVSGADDDETTKTAGSTREGAEGTDSTSSPPDAALLAVTKKSAKGKRKSKKTSSKKTSEGNENPDSPPPNTIVGELLVQEDWGNEPKWYFVQVKPGCEQSCAVSIRNMGVALPELRLQQVLVPTMQVMRLTKSGKSVKKEERMFPSYILVCMVMNKDSYADIQRVPNVQSFMGDPNIDKKKDQPFRPPIPASDEEMRSVFERVKAADAAKPEVKTDIRPGDVIRVTSGQFLGREGTVLEVKPDLSLVSVKLHMIGHAAPTELEFGQMQRIASGTAGKTQKKRGRPAKEKTESQAEDSDDDMWEQDRPSDPWSEPDPASRRKTAVDGTQRNQSKPSFPEDEPEYEREPRISRRFQQYPSQPRNPSSSSRQRSTTAQTDEGSASVVDWFDDFNDIMDADDDDDEFAGIEFATDAPPTASKSAKNVGKLKGTVDAALLDSTRDGLVEELDDIYVDLDVDDDDGFEEAPVIEGDVPGTQRTKKGTTNPAPQKPTGT